jgi:hypothetical protein
MEVKPDMGGCFARDPGHHLFVEYVMDTFRVVRDCGVKAHGKHRMKPRIIRIYDELAEAIATGRPYRTLDPWSADPRVAHPPRTETASVEAAAGGIE